MAGQVVCLSSNCVGPIGCGLVLDTGGQPIERVTYINASHAFTDASGATLHAGPIEIRGRGNSTGGLDKKPYRVRLNGAEALRGMPSSRHCVLLANHADKTLLRNDVAFELGRLLGMARTSRCANMVKATHMPTEARCPSPDVRRTRAWPHRPVCRP